ncbi:oleosin-B3-like isoform X2 [Gambusia affinis]|uniref:oleosin-B3-like isoform X2 n=1 Tax=Gambusia affinis TaxID=33528 RepID=UPI001CDD3268|nr:oleosin-B3-like isoform X2 [Gambusia affinis]
MAVLRWMVLVLAVFLSPQCSLAAVNQNWLTNIIQNLKNEYELGDSYSLAVNLPVNQDLNSLADVLKDDPADAVKQAISTGQVYQGTRVVAAAQSGALAHVLEKIQPLIKSSDGNVLIVYSEGYPDANGIDNKISNIVQNWKSYAFVFSKVADVADANTLQRAAEFKGQELSKFGLENIFRCYEQSDSFQCTNCKAGDNVAPSCVADTMQSNANEETAVDAPEPPAGSDEGTISGLNNGSGIGSVTGTNQEHEGGGMIDVMGGQKPRKGKKRKKGKKGEQGGEVKEGGKHGKGGKVRKSGKCGKGSKMKSGKRGKGCKMRKSGKRGKGGKMRNSGKRGKGGKMRKSGKRGKGSKMRKSGKRGKGSKMRKSGKRGKGSKMRKSGKRGKGGKMRKSGKRKSGKRKNKRRGQIANSA